MTWLRRLYPLTFVMFLGLLWLTQVAAVGNATQTTAYKIVAILGLILPFVPFKQFPWKGPVMWLVTYLVCVILVTIAAFLSGDLVLSSIRDVPGATAVLVASAAPIWTISQAVFGLFKDNPYVGPFLK